MNVIDPEALPLLLPIKQAIAVSGLSRTELYNRLGTGELQGKKMRRSTLIETKSLLSLVEKLPRFGG
jgi:hypothetical protein